MILAFCLERMKPAIPLQEIVPFGTSVRAPVIVPNPAHFRAHYASAIEGLDAPDVQRLCGFSADNLYQIRRRVGARFRILLEEAMRDLDAPDMPAAVQ